MISTLDHISNGRALLWLGAGWYEEEYKAYGYPFPEPKRRVDELEESLTIYKKLLAAKTLCRYKIYSVLDLHNLKYYVPSAFVL